MAVAWPCNCAVAQQVLLICYVLLCCGAAGVAGAAVLVCRGAAGVADAMVLLVAVFSTCWRVSRCCWLLLALQKALLYCGAAGAAGAALARARRTWCELGELALRWGRSVRCERVSASVWAKGLTALVRSLYEDYEEEEAV